ncbi:MAG: hypothetical protein PHD43_20525 [Methylococcales bacterium]|nr:hypothetical protein [Methylococcales bacterium]
MHCVPFGRLIYSERFGNGTLHGYMADQQFDELVVIASGIKKAADEIDQITSYSKVMWANVLLFAHATGFSMQGIKNEQDAHNTHSWHVF